MDERKIRREEIENRIDKHCAVVEARFVAVTQDKLKGRKLKRQRAEKDLHKAGGALARSLGENEEKRRARVARGIVMHGTRVKDTMVGREERAGRGNEGWKAFLNKGWDAITIHSLVSPSSPSTSSALSAASAILNSPPTPNYSKTTNNNPTIPTNASTISPSSGTESIRTNSIGGDANDTGSKSETNSTGEAKEKDNGTKTSTNPDGVNKIKI